MRITPTYIALLRGINVAGKNQLPMKELIPLFTEAGCRAVRNYIQSGNILFQAAPALATRIPALIEKRILERFELRVPVLVRTGDELAAVARNNPLFAESVDIGTLMVMFLADRPSAAAVAALDPDRSPPDVFVVRGKEIYARCPNGFGRTKLSTSYFDSKLSTTSTARNWRTVLTLCDLVKE